ncbi:MAG: stage II sporulation protein P [Oscillospiraceae bacterium]|nr:stage II sporulation protein P [Oscillospiraceae bacterium]
MDHQQQSLRVGAAVILCALLLRLGAAGVFDPLAEFLAQPKISSFLIYLETGRIVRFSASEEAFAVFSPESPEPAFAAEEPAASTAETVPTFRAADADAIGIHYNCTLRPDLQELITRPLTWDLTGDQPTVLILHTHATESYTKSDGENYAESAAFRTLDEDYNMISVGDHLAELLEAGGLTVIHDRDFHDYPSYNGSYNSSRKAMASYLEQYPSIQLVLDIHRDASGNNDAQMTTTATVNGVSSAQLMLVVGTNASGLNHPDWEENMALALKLHAQLERINPGICRDINLRAQRFNQDESPGALLVEVGAAGNTHDEALTAVEVLAQGILALKNGAVVE